MSRRETRFSRFAKTQNLRPESGLTQVATLRADFLALPGGRKNPHDLAALTDLMTRNPVAVWARFWMRWLGR